MTALVFPTSPTVGQNYTANGIAWQWDGTTWKVVTTGTVVTTRQAQVPGGMFMNEGGA